MTTPLLIGYAQRLERATNLRKQSSRRAIWPAGFHLKGGSPSQQGADLPSGEREAALVRLISAMVFHMGACAACVRARVRACVRAVRGVRA